MKLLIYGLDGGDLAVMNIFKDQMPFFQKFLSKNKSIDLTEDLINRGWVEILTGKYGKDTKGFYMAPKLDGTHSFSTGFNMKVVEADENVVPLWEIAEKRKVPYLIMNVPTTTPVPKTKYGIVVGSAGGGLNKVSGIPEILVSDEATREYLERNHYIVDIRIPNDEIKSTEELYEKVGEKELKRTECFIEICRRNSTEFGFLVNRGNTIVQYLSRSAIELYKENQDQGAKHQSWTFPYLEKHFCELDQQFKVLYEELKPEHFIITADHNIVPSKYWANVSPFLIQNGYLAPKKSGKQLTRIKRLVVKILGNRAKKVSKTVSSGLKNSFDKYNWDKSLAFGSTYIPGIYINDKKRFNGPVRDDEIDLIIDKICDDFNKIPNKERLSMKAVPYRSLHKGGRFSDWLPDIKIEGSEGIFFAESKNELCWKNVNYGPIPKNLSRVNHAAFSGDKGENPIFVATKNTIEFIDEKDAMDLTVVYKIIDRLIGSI